MTEEIGPLDAFDKYLAHYGTPRHSGRYPWGSGEDPYQRNKSFLGMAAELKEQGLTELEIAQGMGLRSIAHLRDLKSIARHQVKQADIVFAQRLKDKGMSNVAIGQRMGIAESQVRALLSPATKARNERLEATKQMLKDKLGTEGYLDVGVGAEHHLGIKNSYLKTAVTALQEEGYEKFWVPVEQLGTGKSTNTMVLAQPGTNFYDVKNNQHLIKTVAAFSEDDGLNWSDIVAPVPVDPKRVAVRYAEQGGDRKDGVIELRQGVPELSLGGKKYAQVRIQVGPDRYLKGMAVYADNLPDGVDILFNTNKSDTGNKLEAMKKLESDPELPFKSIVRQRYYEGPDGTERQSPLNIVGDNEEGRWNEWGKTLSSQMLSKQTHNLAKEQLALTHSIKRGELEEILALDNPVVKKKLLEEFADGADASAVHLKAAGLPRTRAQVILPINSLKDHEIYAPNYDNGEKVVLIRHPHGGKFEIPELIVNNNNREAKSVIRNAADAVGINANVAERLSGADFDGDTVLVIPNKAGKIKTQPPLAKLKDFNPKVYQLPEDSPIKRMSNTQRQMGDISNLITDMSLKGASDDELARAVRHSMVVIDAEKHNLNYRQSALDNGIAGLKEKYQGGPTKGASTLISLSKSPDRDILERKPRPAKEGGPIDRETGEKVFVETGNSYVNAKGETVMRKSDPLPKMAVTRDAHTLSSGTVMESVYADHANRMKGLANEARKAALLTETNPRDKEATIKYAAEVDSLKNKLFIAQSNAPLERKAQILARAQVDLRVAASPDLEKSEIKKIEGQELTKARLRIGAKKEVVTFTDREWEAVQANAISNTVLTKLLANADADHVKQLATPRDQRGLTPAQLSRITAMANRGYTQSEIAAALGVSTSTVSTALK